MIFYSVFGGIWMVGFPGLLTQLARLAKNLMRLSALLNCGLVHQHSYAITLPNSVYPRYAVSVDHRLWFCQMEFP